MKTLYYSFIILLYSLNYTGCTIAPPRITLTGKTTVVERQIVGDYKELQEDAWTISSVKKTVQRTKGSGTMTTGDRELYMALMVRDFHRDKLKKYKSKGLVGETNRGLIELMESEKPVIDESEKEILIRVITNENEARNTIFTRTLLKMRKKDPGKEEVEEFGKIFADEQRRLARKNEWIQDKSGKWVRK